MGLLMAFCHRERAQNTEDDKCTIKPAVHNCANRSDLPAPTPPHPSGPNPSPNTKRRLLAFYRRLANFSAAYTCPEGTGESVGGGGGGGLVDKLCPTLTTPVDCMWPARLLCPGDFPGKHTGVGCHSLPQGIFPTQGSNRRLLHLLHCRQILYL